MEQILIVFARNQPPSHLDLGLPASRTVCQLVSVVSATEVVELCYGNPSKPIQAAAQPISVPETGQSGETITGWLS